MKKENRRIIIIGAINILLFAVGVFIAYTHRLSHRAQSVSQTSESAPARIEIKNNYLNNPLVGQILNGDFYVSRDESGEKYEFRDGNHYFKRICGDGNCIELKNYPDSNYAASIDKKNIVVGDLDKDGMEDAALIIGERYGGTGHFLKLFIFRNDNGSPSFVTYKELGDRERIKSINIIDGSVELNMITHGKNDPMCCPTLPITKTYELIEGTLIEK